ncbi:MAG: hypothetical protein BWY66_02189 [bacterium ADurb.Bin374]|nr:MAG: hypothetical protein BWY66_02189 [bacterium ADurb.Bin374]
MPRNPVEGAAGGGFVFRGRSEQHVDIGADPGPMQLRQDFSGGFKPDPFAERVEHLLIAGFEAELKHHAAGSP